MSKQSHTLQITPNVIKNRINPDYKSCIKEYIWNGFDAEAKNININYKANDLGSLEYLKISDNGIGIEIDTIHSTFGQFLDSNKRDILDKNSMLRGKQGKGRYSFITFCNMAVWTTISKNIKYNIEINSTNLVKFETKQQEEVQGLESGTTVDFYNFSQEFSSHSLENDEFIDSLKAEFGWYLSLYPQKSIRINNNILDYKSVIEYSNSETFKIEHFDFDILFIKWNKKINEKYYYYYLTDKNNLAYHEHSSFNNKTQEFYHSVYIKSNYFNNDNNVDNNNSLFSDYPEVYSILKEKLKKKLVKEEKFFIKKHLAPKSIKDLKERKAFPVFKETKYDQIRASDLENVITQIYIDTPGILKNTTNVQAKTIISFLNLLLDSENREHVLVILESIVNLTNEERENFASILKNTKISNINKTIQFLKNRFDTVNILKTMVFDLTKFTNERDHIQKIIENNYWLFGEQYHLVSADQNFEVLLNHYIKLIEGTNPNIKLDSKDKLRRPDIFISKTNTTQHSIDEHYNEEHIIIELKRPSVIIGKEQYNQIEDYITFINKQPEFNSQLRNWTLILVGNKVDDWIKLRYESQKGKGKKFLVESVTNYEIYAYTWDDLFRFFENRHKHLIDNLEFKETILEELYNTYDKEELPNILTTLATS